MSARLTFGAVPRGLVLVGDALARLAELPDSSVDMVLTSPPYYRLRDYGITGQLGLEAHVDQWAGQLTAVAAELRRVLVPTGTFWLNLGDTYSTHTSQGATTKSLLLAPERVALALVAQGWTLRNKIVWAKPNPMPTAVRDRLATTYEVIYVFARSRSYYFDLDAIRTPHRSRAPRVGTVAREPLPDTWRGPNSDGAGGLLRLKAAGRVGHPLGKNPGDVWTIPTAGYRGAHFATYPERLCERAIRAGCPTKRCRVCRSPWRATAGSRDPPNPTCDCESGTDPGLVLDPFLGAGTTAVVAERLERDWLGIELNPTFAALAEQRLREERSKST